MVDSPAPLRLAPPVLCGLLVLAVFFGSLSAWAALAPLQSAAIAPGIVSVETQRKSVQHLEGGIVRSVHAREGQAVQAGEALLTLDTTRVNADHEIVKARLLVALARGARLEAERDAQEHINWPDKLSTLAVPDAIDTLKRREQQALESLEKQIRGERFTLYHQAEQTRIERAGLESVIGSLEVQRRTLSEEEEDLKQLVAKGFEGKSRLLLLQREREELRTSVLSSQSSIERLGRREQELEQEMQLVETRRRNQVIDELQQLDSEISGLQEQLLALRDVLDRTEITSPISGVVVALQPLSRGAVIGPGESLMDIVPNDERLVIEARVNPLDIDQVHAGQRAEVRLSAFNQRHTLPVNADVLTVSADHFTDERSGASYFLARVALDDEDVVDLPVTPGMPVEVLILTGERTTLDYLLQPLMQSFNRAFRES